jgi:outer membrane protein assembly factor BamA
MAIKQKMMFQAGFIGDARKFFPMLRSKVFTQWTPQNDVRIMSELGTTWSSRPMPLYERFRMGGIPLLRGIGHPEFAPHADNIPMGVDHYAAITGKWMFPFRVREQMMAFHVFVNGGVSRLSRSYWPSSDESYVAAMAVIGIGFAWNLEGRAFEANSCLTWPGLRTSNIRNDQLLFFEVGMDMKESQRE